jgi:D-alanyl-D-alanine carboxypeptidase
MQITSSYEEQTIQTLSELGLPTSFVTQRRRPLHCECSDLVSIGMDMFGREQQLERRTAAQWRAMVAAAKHDGVALLAVSGFRSFAYQRKIIERKLAAGLSIDQIISVSALPGFSEHHTGRAVDIGTSGCPPVTEAFDQTPAFGWLARRGHDFGFRMSYPRDNEFGVIYEPWHWAYHESVVRPHAP